MIREDAIVPHGAYLGTALGDHWAVSLPFEHVLKYHPGTSPHDAQLIATLVDHNHCPRASLFEAALRFVIADLEKRKAAQEHRS